MNNSEYHTLAKTIEEIIVAENFTNVNLHQSEEQMLKRLKTEIGLTSLLSFYEDTESKRFLRIKNEWNVQMLENQAYSETFLVQLLQSDEIDLSFPSGLMGLLLSLTKENKKFKNPIVEDFLNQATKLLLRKKMMPKADWQQYAFFPEAFDADTWTSNNILSWTVGDLHIVKFLYRQAAVNPNCNYELIAENIGMYSITRTREEQNEIRDSSFANGSTGLVVLYQALYQETGHESYWKASKYWLEKTKELLQQDLQNDFYEGKETQFLDGLAGVLFVMRALQQENLSPLLIYLAG